VSETARIRSLNTSHRAAVEEIVRATGSFSASEVDVALEVFDDGMKGDDYELIGAFHDDRLVGYACFGPTPSTDRTYDLYWIAVHPAAQHGGAGSALMAEVERRLASRAARLLVIETSSRKDYAPTRRFYEKRGYAISARLRDFYAPGDDRIVFSRRVSDLAEPLLFPADRV
jgi:ribosomal protein S18 acetylase RimI-like enzyme